MQNAECRMQNAEGRRQNVVCRITTRGQQSLHRSPLSTRHSALSTQDSVLSGRHSSFIIHHSSFSIQHFPLRRGLSLLEVLISMFVLTVGLLGVAALIPMGRFAIVEAGKADRSGACGHAAMHEIKVRGMLDYNNWNNAPADADLPFAIDPLGVANDLTGPLGPIARITLLSPTTGVAMGQPEADAIFGWHDKLLFDLPDDADRRPRRMVTDSSGQVGPFPSVSSDPVALVPPA
ncbi:MAG: type IV pilus modification PilV family protein, partial [Planctomycetota bacterium]